MFMSNPLLFYSVFNAVAPEVIVIKKCNPLIKLNHSNSLN